MKGTTNKSDMNIRILPSADCHGCLLLDSKYPGAPCVCGGQERWNKTAAASEKSEYLKQNWFLANVYEM